VQRPRARRRFDSDSLRVLLTPLHSAPHTFVEMHSSLRGTSAGRAATASTLLAVAFVACGNAPSRPEATATSAEPIQGGTTDSTHSFAVAIVDHATASQDTVAICSGALLAPNLVATARHCVAASSDPGNVVCATTTFSSPVPASEIFVSNDTTLNANTAYHTVDEIVVPPASLMCGNDLALLILHDSVQLPEYVTPVIDPPMTDHQVYSTTITAIGYGVTTPADTAGETVGTRRIRENIDLECIPNDTTFADCYSDPDAMQAIAPAEFLVADGACGGDSGSSAYEQRNFNAGAWVSFGVLSRGSVTDDGDTCYGNIYTRFDAWGALLINTAQTAAAKGGYPVPAWAVGDGGTSSSGTSGGSCLPTAAACSSDGDCCTNNCLSQSASTPFACTTCSDSIPCDVGFVCSQGVCVSPSDAAGGGASAATGTTGAVHPGSGGGCSVVPYGGGTSPFALAGFAAFVCLVPLRSRRRGQLRFRAVRRAVEKAK
jgi:V8-like Glu-specific endopeptidase